MSEQQLSFLNYGPLDSADTARSVTDAIGRAYKEQEPYIFFQALHDLEGTLAKEYGTLRTQQPKLYERYARAIASVMWNELAYLQEKETSMVFGLGLQTFLDSEYTVDQHVADLRTRLSSMADREARDAWKADMRNTMATSPVHIGDQDIAVAGSVAEPTVENWLRDWNEFLGERDVDPLIIVEYLNSNANVRKLSAEARAQLEKLLKLDYQLSLSSMTAEGGDDTMMVEDLATGTYKVYDRGQYYDTGIAIDPEQLKASRYVAGLDADGRPLSPAKMVAQQARYVQPNATPTATVDDTVQEPEPPVVVEEPAAPQPEPKSEAPEPLPTIKTAPKKSVPKKASPQTAATPHVNYQRLAQDVLNIHKLLLPSLDAEKRFVSIMSSYLRDVRDTQETTEALTKPLGQGGVDMSAADVAQVLATARELRSDAINGHSQRQPRHGGRVTPDAFVPTFDQLQQRMTEQHVPEHIEDDDNAVEDIFANVNPIFDSMATTPPAAPPLQSASTRAARPRMAADIFAPGTVAPASTPTGAEGQPIVMGPIEELKNMSLEEFRRLASDPHLAADNVLNKLSLLEEESISKRADGIEAWKHSALNQQYITIGNESLRRSVPIADVIADMRQQDPEAMTQDEFDAVADLNRKMRF